MSPTSRSRMDADISMKSRQRTGTRNPRPIKGAIGTFSPPGPQLQSFGPHERVRAALARVLGVVNADEELLLPPVSLNDLAKALSAFLAEARLGLDREPRAGATTSTRTGAYSHKLRLELVDPEISARVRANRRAVQKDLDSKFLERKGENASMGKVSRS